ncbi:DNA topoisomerase IB [Yimella sp. cx-51]|uniref:DNA topoisomerase IB n=1 Tax=Yimella sp. cx-51 TaxID=2770551 RepID=UPI00165DFD1C|nr:DNA topoisomerase IB [Yimella sp. cx-51]MBC9958331.1 DNA topoisomerase IB [Yimella sp. cx-51]QTH38223.1 DNA topoisomerase IB [Yimella sp. cx-51]
MPRLRKVSPTMRGYTRQRRGKGFSYADADGAALSAEDVERIKALVIPPAWQDVWICPLANGHIQATGMDAAGRRQYLYHPDWRIKRDKMKFDRVLTAAAGLPKARKQIVRDLSGEGMTLDRASATAVRLIDLGYFRIGSDAYADTNGSFGLTTLERRHVKRGRDGLVFKFVGKSGVEHTVTIDDKVAIEALDRMRSRRGGSGRLLAYKNGRSWVDLDAASVNAYLATLFGGDLTAKDFRTWHATVLAAAALAESTENGDSKASRKRAVKAAVEEVATYLGNTPTVARGSYIDPRVLDLYESGTTITVPRTKSIEKRREALEKAVVELLA